ncbi:MAG: DNA translocase FtsK, partial [Dehalococcoidales bacterium]|nr:DNA translocase FtsK [Dehalococcoidales bacterium]
MARKKVLREEKEARERPARQPSSGGFFHLLFSRPMRQLFLIIIVVTILAVLQDSLQKFFQELRVLFGWGTILILIAILTPLTVIWRRQWGSFIHRWNWWLAGIAFGFAIWGILGIIEYQSDLLPNGLGGRFGYALVGSPSPADSWEPFLGSLRILGLVILGVFFAMPRVSLRALKRFSLWLYGRAAGAFSRHPRTATPPLRPVGEETRGTAKALPSGTRAEPSPGPDVSRTREKLDELARRAQTLKAALPQPSSEAPAAAPELRRVTEDVWKKYGQTRELVEVDGWKLPPADILDTSPEVQFSEEDNLQRARLIEETLASFGVEAKVVQINAGPTVTQFGVEPGWDRKYKEVKEKDKDGKVHVRLEEVSRTRVKVERISSLANDLALALAAPTIRIEAPVPGKTYVGIEVPNTTSDIVSLRGVVESNAFQKMLTKTKLALALGKGAGGEAVVADLTKMPHLLIAGATGSGKTVCLNTIICCLLMYNTPNDVRFILIDPKRVELTQYNSIPHLVTPVIVETDKAIGALRWLLEEMDQRYKKMAAVSARNIEAYNKDRHGKDRLPYIVLIVDELADLMMAGFDEVESSLCRLAQLSRATGIHLIVATQRPSVDVVTGLIKANFPTRISFAVTSQVDSRTILDIAGAEKLLGRGDMLYMPTEAAKPKRLQGCFLSDNEIERLVNFWAVQRKETPDNLRLEALVSTTPCLLYTS